MSYHPSSTQSQHFLQEKLNKITNLEQQIKDNEKYLTSVQHTAPEVIIDKLQQEISATNKGIESLINESSIILTNLERNRINTGDAGNDVLDLKSCYQEIDRDFEHVMHEIVKRDRVRKVKTDEIEELNRQIRHIKLTEFMFKNPGQGNNVGTGNLATIIGAFLMRREMNFVVICKFFCKNNLFLTSSLPHQARNHRARPNTLQKAQRPHPTTTPRNPPPTTCPIRKRPWTLLKITKHSKRTTAVKS